MDKAIRPLVKTKSVKEREKKGRENKTKTLIGSHLHYIYRKPKTLKWAIIFLSSLIVDF